MEMRMKEAAITTAIAVLALHGSPAHAESLRCNGHSAAEGDSKLSVLYMCGQGHALRKQWRPTLQGGKGCAAAVVRSRQEMTTSISTEAFESCRLQMDLGLIDQIRRGLPIVHLGQLGRMLCVCALCVCVCVCVYVYV